jgi:hypothetical protein
MSDFQWIIVGAVMLSAEAFLFGILNEMLSPLTAERMQSFLRYLSETPSPKSRKKHKKIAVSVILTIVFALAPLGFTIMESHPCGAWTLWFISFLFGAYSSWSLMPMFRWARMIAIVAALCVFGFYLKRGIYSKTELDFPFVNPGVFIVREGGDWLLLVTGENTRKPVFSVEMRLRDMVTARAIPNEPDPARREAMIAGSMIEKNYPELNPTSSGDRIMWRPMDVNNQEYSAQFWYRMGDQSFMSNEEIRISNVGTRFVRGGPGQLATWQFSVTVRNQKGDVLMHCVDPKFPRDARWSPGPACLPSKYRPLPRSLCARCFGRNFEYSVE